MVLKCFDGFFLYFFGDFQYPGAVLNVFFLISQIFWFSEWLRQILHWAFKPSRCQFFKVQRFCLFFKEKELAARRGFKGAQTGDLFDV